MTSLDHTDSAARFAAQQSGNIDRRLSFGLAERRAALEGLRGAIRRFEPDLTAAMASDFGKPAAEVLMTEILTVQLELDHALRRLRRWMRPRRVPASFGGLGTSARIRPEPRGTVLIIAAWNYPFNLAISPLVSALAAGNSAIVKPSELAPATSAVIARLVAETFDPGLVHVVEGGKAVAEELLALPFDHIFFTGSPEVGQVVMAAAAKTLASVTLELGGKSPAIVGPGADIAQAAAWIAFGKFTNAGQTCIAPDHVFVHDALHADFVAALRARIVAAYGGDTTSPHLAAIVNERHGGRLRGLLDDALAQGAQLLHGGGASGQHFEPTLLDAVTPDMQIDSKEIFGPILPMLPYSDIDEVIARINSRPKPLALYMFEKDRALVERVIAATSSGGVGINLAAAHFSHPGLPFGGIGNSGIGSSHGEHGFSSFSHERAILTNRLSPLPLLFAPYSGRTARLLKLVRRVIG
jgi:aldehyde dehydrogenase (NAD+)